MSEELDDFIDKDDNLEFDTTFENITPWNGANDDGYDVRMKWLRNFEKIRKNFDLLSGLWSLKIDSDGKKYAYTNFPIVGAAGMTMFAGDEIKVDSIFKGLPIDTETLQWVDGVLTVVGGTGGASNWDDLEGKPSWITSEKPKYSYTEITGLTEELEKYVTLSTDQSITGMKDFTDGMKVSGTLFKVINGVLTLDCSIAVTGGITAYALGEQTAATIMDGVAVDGITITKEDGVLKVVGGGGASNWDELEGKPSWITDIKPVYTWGEITQKPTTLSGYGIQASDVLNTLKSVDGTGSGLDADTLDGKHYIDIINGNVVSATKLQTARTIWGQSFDGTKNITGTFLYSDEATLRIYSDYNPTSPSAYGKETACIQSCFDSKDPESSDYVTKYPNRSVLSLQPRGGYVGIGTTSPSYKLEVNGSTSTTNLYINGIQLHKTADGVITLEGNLAVTGGITQFAVNEVSSSTIMDGVVVDGTSIKKENGVLKVMNAGGGEAGSVKWANIDGKPTTLAGYSITASDVLSTLKTVDGSGSGLDADTLDGVHLEDIQKKVGYGWTTIYKVNNWSRIMKIDGYANILLSINFSQDYQASNHLYLISIGYAKANIIQIGANNYDRYYGMKIRVTEPSNLVHYVEIYSNYGYNGATDISVKCNYLKLDYSSAVTVYTVYTVGGDTVRKEITSSYNKIVSDLQGNADTATNADMIDGTHKTGLFTSLTSSTSTNLSITIGGTTKSITDFYANSAAKLETSRTLWGQQFNGTDNVSGNIIDTQAIKSKSGYHLDLYGDTGIAFYTEGTAKGAFRANGNFGVGTTNPSHTIHVLGDIYATTKVEAEENIISHRRIECMCEENSELYPNILLHIPNVCYGQIFYKSDAFHFTVGSNQNASTSDYRPLYTGNITISKGSDSRLTIWDSSAYLKQVNISETDISGYGLYLYGSAGTRIANKLLVDSNAIIKGDIIIKGNESSDITSDIRDNGVIENLKSLSNNLSSIRNSLTFNWYNTSWYIGNIRGSSTSSLGFGIVSNTKCYLRVNTDATYVYGNLLVTGGGTFYSSDIRAKTIIDKPKLGLNSIANAPVIKFRWNGYNNLKDDGKLHIGGIAQYIEKILPECVVGQKDDFLSFDYATVGYVFSVLTARHLLSYETRTDRIIRKLKERIRRLERQLNIENHEEVCFVAD